MPIIIIVNLVLLGWNGVITLKGDIRIMETIEQIRKRIEDAAKKLGLDAQALMREYGVTTALAEMLEREVNK